MKYLEFRIQHYRAIENDLVIDLQKSRLIPLVGINECGKTTILQALFCFDYFNDNENGGKHLKDTLNLYKTTDENPTVTAKIELGFEDLKEIIIEYNLSLSTLDENKKIEEGLIRIENPFTKTSFPGIITIVRNLVSKMYSITEFNLISEKIQDKISRKIITELPYTLYNDDFNDKPTTKIEIPSEQPENLSGWLAIYERVFKSTNEKFSLFTIIKENDSRRKNTILSDVKEHLNSTISKAWKSFSNDHKGNIEIKIDLNSNSQTKKEELEISIVEKIGTKERYFDILDRSKGFIWYFNFIMKIQFNPKIAGNDGETIFLLDEPGSYLHANAQEKLCSKLNEISQNHGNVIYCTHSHHLLNPNFIAPNKIQIVEKSKNKSIFITPLSLLGTNIEKTNALQPIFEALQVPVFEYYASNTKIIAVEGIFDKYVLELFCNQKSEFIVLPGTSADSVIKNIQYLIAYNKDYIAIWDNDEEGRKAYKRAISSFGEREAKRFDLLPSGTSNKCRMEQMFSEEFTMELRKLLKLDNKSNYESILLALFYSEKKIKKKAIDILDGKTNQNLKKLDAIILKRFTESKNMILIN